MRWHTASVIFTFLLAAAAVMPLRPALAQNDPYGLNTTCQAAGCVPSPDADPLPRTLGTIINWTLGLLGFIFLMLMIFAGIAWMTAGGNEEKVAKAKMQIQAAIAGMIVIFISYALADAIVGALIAATGTG